MTKINNIERSTIDKHMPRYYDGYDIDNLLIRINNNEQLAIEEWHVVRKAREVFAEEVGELKRKAKQKMRELKKTEITSTFTRPGRVKWENGKMIPKTLEDE